MIRWNEPKFGEREKELVNEVLDSGYVSEGPKTKELEEKLAKIVGTKFTIMTTSCTAALYLAIEADKYIKKYTEGNVIMPDLTFLATKNAIEMAGLNPKIVDVDKDDYCLKTHLWDRCTITVNLLGRSATDEKFNDIKGDRATLICDNAGALGSNVPNGKVGCYSLQGNKIISCGQGGFCATDDEHYATIIRRLKDFGRKEKDDNNTIGFNFKFNDILAAVALGQLDELEDRKKILIKQYLEYKKQLSNYGTFIDFNIDDGEVPLWVEFICKGILQRNDLFNYLKDKGVSCRKPWNSITGCVNSKYYSDHCIWLPNGPMFTSENQIKVIQEIKRYFHGV